MVMSALVWCCLAALQLASTTRAEPTARAAPLESAIQSVLDRVAAATGYGLAVGYRHRSGVQFAAGAGPRTGPAAPARVPGLMGGNDTVVLGSGSKPYTAAAVLRLVQAGRVALSDRVAVHSDPVTSRLWGVSLVGLFGEPAAELTVDQLLRMASGLPDIEAVPGRERRLLLNGSIDDPIADLRAVAAAGWHFRPGAHTEYSSTNYLLAALVVLRHTHGWARLGWREFDMSTALGRGFSQRFAHSFFPAVGPLNKVGLSCPGRGVVFGRAEVWEQDASIMGLGWGFVTASAWDVAQFYYDLLGPEHRVVSEHSLAYMKRWQLLSYGWDNGTKRYGAGLETNNPSGRVAHWRAPPLDDIATGIGHHGQTYGFEMLAGWYPALNASIAVVVNQDSFRDFERTVSCNVVQAVARYSGWTGDLNCTGLTVD